MATGWRRLTLSVGLAAILIVLPSIMILDFSRTPLFAERMVALLFPGMFLAMLLAGNVHSFSAWFSVLASLTLWTLVFYGVFALLAHRSPKADG